MTNLHTLSRIALSAALLILPLPLLAAESFAQLTYRKSEPDRFVDQLALVEQWVVPVMRQMVDDGEIDRWELWRVRYPYGGDYDLVAVSVVDDFARLEPDNAFRTTFDTVHPRRDTWARFIEHIGPTSEVVRTEIWRMDHIVGEANARDTYIRLTYVKPRPGMGPRYDTLTQEAAVPYWREAKASGMINTWSSHTLIEPGPGAAPHARVGVSGYESWASMAPRDDIAQIFARAHPGKDLARVIGEFGAASDQVRQETWQMVHVIE